MSKFDSARDEALHTLGSESSWADKYGGDSSDGPIGWFGAMSISRDEASAAYVALDEFGMGDLIPTEPDVDELVGHWLLREHLDGTCTVESFPDEAALDDAFVHLYTMDGSLRPDEESEPK